MAIKSKNWISHWLVKLTTLLLIVTTFLWYTNSFFNKLNTGELESIFTDFRHSDNYLKLVDDYYSEVFDAYLDSFAYLSPERVTKLDAVADKYYLVVTEDSRLYSNIPEVKTYLDNLKVVNPKKKTYNLDELNQAMNLLYSSHLVSDVYHISGESEPYFGPKGTYFTKRTHGTEEIYMGFSSSLITAERAKYELSVGDLNRPFFTETALSVGIVLLGMICLAFLSGKRPDSDAIHLNYLDWLYLDCLFLLWVLVEAALIGIGGELLYATGQYAIKPLFLTSAAISAFMGLWVWTSCWKRLKTRTLLSHTLLNWCFHNTVGWAYRHLKRGYQTLKTGPIFGYSLVIMGAFIAANIFSLILLAFFIDVFSEIGFIFGMFVYMIPNAALFIYLVHNDQQIDMAVTGLSKIQSGDLSHKIKLRGSHMFSKLSDGINNLSQSLENAVNKAIQSERMKTELITNVSHDLKTPLTSIINYVDLLKREGLASEEAPHYLEVLDQKTEQLKKLTLDLFDAAKAASGSLSVNLETLHTVDFMNQLIGEYEDQLLDANLQLITIYDKAPALICADGRHLWRVFDNLFGNILKYAAKGSRVYLEVISQDAGAAISLKNMSSAPLNMPAHELLERFKRGDESRTTEGSGLGLSIAFSLCEIQGGHLELSIDGDLFKTVVWLPSSCQSEFIEPLETTKNQ